MEWNHDAPDDIDLYVQDPTQSKVHFRLPITNFMYLDKDDLGYANDIVKNVDGTITKVNINREVVTIRGIIPGEYIINAHYYSQRQWEADGRLNTSAKPEGKELTVKIELHKVSPYKIWWIGEKRFTRRGQEETFVRFTIDPEGKVLTVKIELHKVNPYKIWWMGEKTFTHRGQEETFVRFTIGPDGNQIGDFTYIEKKFVSPYQNTIGSAPDNFDGEEHEPGGASTIISGTEESHYVDNMRQPAEQAGR